MTFTYLFDPLCGWCYAAAPAIAALREANLGNIAMAPVGLFYEPRPTSEIAEFAKTNDLKIQSLSGQEFSQAYFENVLQKSDGEFSSRALTRAIIYLESQQLGLAGPFLHAAQIRRYVDGADTSENQAVSSIACEVAQEHGLTLDQADILAHLESNEALHTQANQMVKQAGQLLQQLPSSGVPQLVMTSDNGQSYIFSGADLYQGGEGFIQLLTTIKQATNMQ